MLLVLQKAPQAPGRVVTDVTAGLGKLWGFVTAKRKSWKSHEIRSFRVWRKGQGDGSQGNGVSTEPSRLTIL